MHCPFSATPSAVGFWRFVLTDLRQAGIDLFNLFKFQTLNSGIDSADSSTCKQGSNELFGIFNQQETYAQRYQQIVLYRKFAKRNRIVSLEGIRLAKILRKDMNVAAWIPKNDLVVATSRWDDIWVLRTKFSSKLWNKNWKFLTVTLAAIAWSSWGFKSKKLNFLH